MELLEKLKPVSLLLLRWTLGIIFMVHGYPKLFGHTSNFQEAFVRFGLPAWLVYVAAVLEFFGGGMLIVGLFTRPVALLLAGEMAIAIWRAHLGHGILAVNDYQFPLALCAAAFALATVGAGAISLDHPIFRPRTRSRGAKSKD